MSIVMITVPKEVHDEMVNCLKALTMIANWDESCEDKFDDPGYCAIDALEKYNKVAKKHGYKKSK